MQIRFSMLTLPLSLAAFAVTPALAATSAAKPKTAQHQKMTECSHQSKGMKGEAHKQFMNNCLKNKSAAPMNTGGKASQQDKMKSCNAEAKSKSLKGPERKSFMSTCLKG